MPTKNEEVARRVSDALAASGLKQVQLARRLKVTQPTVHGWVNGTHGITWANVRRIARALRVSPGWIAFGSDEESERAAQDAEELAFLRMFREKDDDSRASLLMYLSKLPGGRRESP